MKGISRLLNKKCKRFKHHIRNILQNDIANKYITPPPPLNIGNYISSTNNLNKLPPPPVLECLYTAY